MQTSKQSQYSAKKDTMAETNENNTNTNTNTNTYCTFPNNGVIIDKSNQQPPLKATVTQLSKILHVIEEEILPKTKKGIQKGNKVFGAALLNKDFECTIAETNDELNNPLFHGEVNLINAWAKITDACDRGQEAQEAIFISTNNFSLNEIPKKL